MTKAPCPSSATPSAATTTTTRPSPNSASFCKTTSIPIRCSWSPTVAPTPPAMSPACTTSATMSSAPSPGMSSNPSSANVPHEDAAGFVGGGSVATIPDEMHAANRGVMAHADAQPTRLDQVPDQHHLVLAGGHRPLAGGRNGDG